MRSIGMLVGATLLLSSLASAQSVNLRFTTWAGGDGLALLQTLAKEYSARTPGVQVTVEVTPFADYGRKLAVQLASGDSPDVGWLAERDVPAFIASKALLDLSGPLGKDAGFNLADFPPSALSLFKKGTALYGVPFSNSPVVLFYNKDLFAQAGVKTPLAQYAAGTWTYDAFRDAARTIKGKTGAFGGRVMRLDPKAWSGGLLAVLWSYGGGVFDKDFRCAMNTPGSVAGMNLVYDMMFKDASMPRPGDQTAFEGGRLGMYADNVSYSAQMKDAKFKWGIAPMPKGPAGRVTQLGQAGYVAFAASKHPKEATDFLKFLASADVMKRTAKFFPPPRKSVLNSSAYLSANPAIPAADLKAALVSQISGARVMLTNANWLKANDIITAGLDTLLQPNANVKSVLDGICSQVNGL